VFLEGRDGWRIGNGWRKVVPDASCRSAEGAVTDRLWFGAPPACWMMTNEVVSECRCPPPSAGLWIDMPAWCCCDTGTQGWPGETWFGQGLAASADRAAVQRCGCTSDCRKPTVGLRWALTGVDREVDEIHQRGWHSRSTNVSTPATLQVTEELVCWLIVECLWSVVENWSSKTQTQILTVTSLYIHATSLTHLDILDENVLGLVQCCVLSETKCNRNYYNWNLCRNGKRNYNIVRSLIDWLSKV